MVSHLCFFTYFLPLFLCFTTCHPTSLSYSDVEKAFIARCEAKEEEENNKIYIALIVLFFTFGCFLLFLWSNRSVAIHFISDNHGNVQQRVVSTSEDEGYDGHLHSDETRYIADNSHLQPISSSLGRGGGLVCCKI